MELFYFIVISIAVIILIVILTYIGIMMNKNVSVNVYPPISNTCPDTWQVDACGNCVIPTNGNNLGTFSLSVANSSNTPGLNVTSNSFNPTSISWSSGKGMTCGKRLWANTYNIQWDGVTNYNAC
jgi:hypothetical protein